MEFTPEKPTETRVTYFDDATGADGWEGHTTTKSIERLQSEIITSLSRMGGNVVSIQSGKFGDRHGFQIHYSLKDSGGRLIPGRIDIACLPLKMAGRYDGRRGSINTRIEKTKKMALYMTEKALNGMWFLEQLSPGFFSLMPTMLAESGKTFGELWFESGIKQLSPPSDTDFIDGEVVDEN